MQNEILIKRDELQEILFLACYAKHNATNALIKSLEVTEDRLEQISNVCCDQSNVITIKLD